MVLLMFTDCLLMVKSQRVVKMLSFANFTPFRENASE